MVKNESPVGEICVKWICINQEEETGSRNRGTFEGSEWYQIESKWVTYVKWKIWKSHEEPRN